MSLTLKRQTDIDDHERRFFYVHDTSGKVVGRIYRAIPAGSKTPESWFWGLSHFPGIGPAPHYGNAPTKEDAMAAFKARWLLSHK